jgi:hypothetical protein
VNALFTGIYSKIGTAESPTDFYTAIGGRFYHVKAPQGATFPYGVYDMIDDSSELDFNEENLMITIQIDVFAEDNSAKSAGVILGHQKALFDDCALTVSGWRFLSMTREWTVPNHDISRVPPIMGYSSQYEIELEKAR